MNKMIWGVLAVILLSFLSFKAFTEVSEIEELHDKFYPAIYGDYIVWEDDRNGNLDIYGYNIQEGKEFPITKNSGNQLLPALSRNYIIWQDNRNGNWDIYGCSILTREEDLEITREGDQLYPALSQDYLVWQDNRSGDWDIHGYNLSTKQEFRITAAWHEQQFPATCEDIVVWQDNRNGNWDIYGYDVIRSREFQITENLQDQQFPALYYDISKDTYTVIWMDLRDGNWNIYGRVLQWDKDNGYSLSEEEEGEKGEFPITTNSNQQRSPAIYGDIVVWYDSRNCYNDSNDWDIYGYNISEKQEFQITATEHDQKFPGIYKDTVVWMDYKDCSWNISSCKIPRTPKLFIPKTSLPSCPDQPFSYYDCIVVPLSLLAVLLVYTVAEKFPTEACGGGRTNSPKEMEQHIHWVNPLRDPLSNLLLGRWKIFLALLSLFLVLLIITNLHYGTLKEIDINSLPRERVVHLYEEVLALPMRKDAPLILVFLIPLIIYYPAKRFFCYIPGVFRDLFDDGIITLKGRTSEEALNNLNKSLEEFEKRINEKYMYLTGFLLSCFNFFRTFISIQNESLGYVSWLNSDFFPGNSIVQDTLELLIFFAFGIFVWKMLCVVHFMWKLNKDYDLELKPFDVDGLGGFQPFEELWLRMSYMAIPVIIIPFAQFLLSYFLGTAFKPFSTSLVSCIVVVVLLVVPVLIYRHIVETRKISYLDDTEKKIEKYQERIEECIQETEKDLEYRCMRQIEHLQKIVLVVKSIPSLPFKKYQKAFIFASALVPWIMGIISYFT